MNYLGYKDFSDNLLEQFQAQPAQNEHYSDINIERWNRGIDMLKVVWVRNTYSFGVKRPVPGKNYIYMRLVSKNFIRRNPHLLTMDFLDMNIVYYHYSLTNEQYIYKDTPDITFSVDIIHRIAKRNMEELGCIIIPGDYPFDGEITINDIVAYAHSAAIPQFFISANNIHFGAAIILCSDVLGALSDLINDDLIIIPCDSHGVFVYGKRHFTSEHKTLLKNRNETHFPRNLILSDSIILFPGGIDYNISPDKFIELFSIYK